MDQILIIDDDPYTRDMLKSTLEDSGYSILEAEHGKEALKILETEHPKVALVDLTMPIMDGITFLQHLSPQQRQRMAIIVLTGGGGEEEAKACYALGVQSFLRKPVNLFELKGIIRNNVNMLKASLKISQLNYRLSTLLHHIPDLIWETDESMTFTYLSDNLGNILGYEKKEVLGKQLGDLIHEESMMEFAYKFNKETIASNEEIRGVSLYFHKKDGSKILMQVSANIVTTPSKKVTRIFGISRDLSQMEGFQKNLEKISQSMGIKIDENLRIIEADDLVKQFFPVPIDKQNPPEITPYLTDANSKDLLLFCLDQKEDLPFPIDIKIVDGAKATYYNTKLTYDSFEQVLTGTLTPADSAKQMDLITQKVEQQEADLKSSVKIDDRMQKSIIKDSNNLSEEILEIIRGLKPFAYVSEFFDLEDYNGFLRNKNVFNYKENIRQLGNKVHGLKGTTGFLSNETKTLCHQFEELIRPLAGLEIALTGKIHQVMMEFIFFIQEALEKFEQDPHALVDPTSLVEKIFASLTEARVFIGKKQPDFAGLIESKSIDKGEVRKRTDDSYLSVSQAGYELLAQQVKGIFYSLSESIEAEHLIQARNRYNEFLDTHQKIKKVPMNLNRYERIIPNLAKEYGKTVNFLYNDNNVLADREFWGGMHEIFNHTLKNAVIHGIETEGERTANGKDSTGNISVEFKENALNIFITLTDDGQGIDIDKVKEKALSTGAISREALAKMSDEELIKLIFIQGISTASSLDDNAGRGVGLNAVQEVLAQFRGYCGITSEKGKGTSWTFTFPKKDVSLPCFVVTIGEFRIAIPEDNVEAFYGYDMTEITSINQKPAFNHDGLVIPLMDADQLFDEEVFLNEEGIKRILVLQPSRDNRVGLAINDIIHSETLPVIALPEEYRDISLFLGATFYGNEPVLVLNTNELKV